MFYAGFNRYADMRQGKRGFLNSWEICRFNNRQERDKFVAEYENKNSRVLTRKSAAQLFASQYLSVGKPIPKGGLFGDTENFANERDFWGM